MRRRKIPAKLKKELALVTVWQETSAPIDIFIDPEKGNDETGDGSMSMPFKSLARLKKLFGEK